MIIDSIKVSSDQGRNVRHFDRRKAQLGYPRASHYRCNKLTCKIHQWFWTEPELRAHVLYCGQ